MSAGKDKLSSGSVPGKAQQTAIEGISVLAGMSYIVSAIPDEFYTVGKISDYLYEETLKLLTCIEWPARCPLDRARKQRWPRHFGSLNQK